MQVVKLTIPGKFWDSQIYSGYLYLFGRSKDITVLNWDQAISNLATSDDLTVAKEIAFRNSDWLYSYGATKLLRDPEIRSLLIAKLETLSSLNLELKITDDKQDNPLPFPHIDTEIYYHRIYASAKSGAYSAATQLDKIKTSKIHKIWDVPTFDLSASFSYTTLALAAGSEGLYELKQSRTNNTPLGQPIRVTKSHCTLCDWTFHNMYGSSHIEPAFFASFKKSQINKGDIRITVRDFERTISSTELFGGSGFSWGVQDKIYQKQDEKIKVLRYNPNPSKNHDQTFEFLGDIALDSRDSDLVSASVSPFGTVLELDDRLIVLQSDERVLQIDGEPVNWRVFPRSLNYNNQLHIIYGDRLEIWSFWQDYFVDQDRKKSGIKK